MTKNKRTPLRTTTVRSSLCHKWQSFRHLPHLELVSTKWKDNVMKKCKLTSKSNNFFKSPFSTSASKIPHIGNHLPTTKHKQKMLYHVKLFTVMKSAMCKVKLLNRGNLALDDRLLHSVPINPGLSYKSFSNIADMKHLWNLVSSQQYTQTARIEKR